MKAILAKLIESEILNVFSELPYDLIITHDNSSSSIESLIYDSFYELPAYLQDYKGSWGTSELQRLVGSGYVETAHNMADALAIKIIKYEMGI